MFRGKNGNQAGGDVWETRVVLGTFGETREAGNRVRFHRDFKLAPGEYRVDVTLEDLNGARQSKAQGKVRAPDFGPGALGLGDLQFGFCGTDSSFILLPSRKYEANLEAMCVRGSVYDRRGDSAPRAYRVQSKVVSETGEDLARADTVLTLGPGGEFYLHPNVRDLFLGAYTLEVESGKVSGGGAPRVRSRSRP